MKNFIQFENQVCLVTGAGSPTGIGFASAKLLGSLGGKIVLISTTARIYDRVAELAEEGIEAKGFIADLTDPEQVQAVVAEVTALFGKIDVLVNNAGMTQIGSEEKFTLFSELTHQEWDESMKRNLDLCFHVTRAVLPLMIEQSYGRIVNVSSVTGPVVSNPGEATYSAAKAAIVGMSRAIAIEVAKHHIMINNVLPGWIATASQTPEEAAGGFHTPAGRGGDPLEVANMIVFLASMQASYITGQSFIVDGGNTIQEYKGPPDLYY